MNTNEKYHRKKPTLGQKAADIVTTCIGSWGFIVAFLILIVIWMILNTYFVIIGVFDPFPFILLNLALSCLAAIQAPIIMMSQNREAERDRQTARRDYLVDRKAEKEIKVLQKDLLEIKAMLLKQPQTEEIEKLENEILNIQEELGKVEKLRHK